MSIAQIIADIGESPTFVAFAAHAFFAAWILDRAAAHCWIAAGVILVVAAWKEFYQDIRFERFPPQTYADGAGDFAGYVAGIAIGLTTAVLL